MKRICAFALAIVMIFALSACGCEHEWIAATCTAPETCLLCGETQGEVLGHEWTEATCTERRTCTRCGEGEGVPLGHDYGDWEITIPAGYSTKGEMSRVCSVCGAVETRELPMLTDIVIGEYESFAIAEESASDESGAEAENASDEGGESAESETLIPVTGIILTMNEDNTFELNIEGNIFTGKWVYGDYENDGLRLYVLEESTENMLCFVNMNDGGSYDLSLTVSGRTILFYVAGTAPEADTENTTIDEDEINPSGEEYEDDASGETAPDGNG